MFTTSCVFVSLFCCMLISNTSFYVQDNLVRPNWCQGGSEFCTYACQPMHFFTGQPVHCSRASPSASARLQPKPIPPEPVLAARNGASRADGLARARRITAVCRK